MAMYKMDEIVAYNFGDKIVCINCTDEEDIVDQDGIITQKDVDAGDSLYFCDDCKERIT
jgi:uncharacterized protein YlaI